MKALKRTIAGLLQNYADFLIYRIENCESVQEYETLVAQAMRLDHMADEMGIELQ